MSSPFDQSTYQVRLDWGLDGVARLAPADVYVVVDVIRFSSTVAATVSDGGDVALSDAAASSINGAAVAEAASRLPHAPVVLVGALRNASAVARAVKAEQERRAARTSVAIIAAGERTPDGGLRFAVEDHLGAGAVIDALTPLGIDHSSPEAVAAAESFAALRRAVKHLLTSSGSGRELEGDPRHPQVLAAAKVDDLDVVPVLRDGVFTAF
ncbi:2-phosphosulfolactate phosphatase [Microbacterium sp. NPDC096154]|uniref:2-phosphosulfolactate phosphatase n=1 Tax=Microbacterium sp. NPDC096154 TaxID=3155549 RepID=UPI0033216365